LSATKSCIACREQKSLDEYHKDKNQKDGRAKRCKDCVRSYMATYNRRADVRRREKLRGQLRTRDRRDRYLSWDEIEASLAETGESPRQKYRRSNKGRLTARVFSLKYKYGLTLDDFYAMLKRQRKKCAICRAKFLSLDAIHVDHCHRSNTVRGLLCKSCNAGLGLFKDSKTLLSRANRYLNGPRPSRKVG